jgi:hypothetical protein
MKKLHFFTIIIISFCFISNLCSCSTEFKGYTKDGKKLINYKFSSKYIEWGPKEVFVRTITTERTIEYNVECETYGYCCGYDGCGYAYDCDGRQKFVTYEYKENVYRKELKLKGGRIIYGPEYTKESEKIIDQAKCIQNKK